MYKQLLLILTFCLFGILLNAQIQSDQVGKSILVVTKSGEAVKGKIKSVTEDVIEIFDEEANIVQIAQSNIEYTKDLQEVSVTETMLEDVIPVDEYNSNRYFISPSGYSIPKGKSYYENIGVFFNSFGFGISDNFSLSVGAEIISLLYGHPILYISPRFHVEDTQGFAWSLGATFLTSPSDNFTGIGVFQSAFTFGDRNNNLTIGGGYGFTTEGFENTVVPITVSGVRRLSRKVALITDNFLILSGSEVETSVLSAGIRLFISNKGAAVNLSLWRPLEDIGGLAAFPFASFSLPIK